MPRNTTMKVGLFGKTFLGIIQKRVQWHCVRCPVKSRWKDICGQRGGGLKWQGSEADTSALLVLINHSIK
jgi:hypothetical protein